MGLSISILVDVPDTIDPASVIRLGERCCTSDTGEPMGIGEAIQYAFNDPGGVTALATLGVTWTAIETA